MNITQIEVRPSSGGIVVGWANIQLDNTVAINDLRIMRNKDGTLSVRWPVSQLTVGSRTQYVCCPVTREAQQEIDRVVVAEFEKMIRKEKHNG